MRKKIFTQFPRRMNLAKGFSEKTLPPFCGFRIKSFAPETRKRAVRTLDLFLTNLLEKTARKITRKFCRNFAENHRKEEVEILAELLDRI